MARKRFSSEAIRAKWLLADRLRTIRTEIYGEHGLAELARQLDVPVRTWYSYESGVTVPGEILLRFVELTLVDPAWLLHGRGEKYQMAVQEPTAAGETSSAESYERSEPFSLNPQRVAGSDGDDSLEVPHSRRGARFLSGASANGLPKHEDGAAKLAAEGVEPWFFAAPSAWRPAPSDSLCAEVEDDAMAPIIAQGAFVGFSGSDEAADDLEGKLVVAHVEGRTIVRWFHRSGRYAALRVENPAFEPRTDLLPLDRSFAEGRIRRVLWVGTPH